MLGRLGHSHGLTIPDKASRRGMLNVITHYSVETL